MVSKESVETWTAVLSGDNGSKKKPFPWIGWAITITGFILFLGAIFWLSLFILITAFGYFGFELTYWQAFVVSLASIILFGRVK